MAPPLERQLIVADDYVSVAVDQIVALQPRSIALSGGSTPLPVYERLATADLPWRDIDVFMGDERCVPFDHPDSNWGMAMEALLSKVPAQLHPPPAPACDPGVYEMELRRVFGEGLPQFDLQILGIGTDGHTASLFPGAPSLAETSRFVLRVEPGQPPLHPRITLTLPVLSASRCALFVVTGPEKRDALQRLLDGDESAPAARVRAEKIVIVADRAAAPG